MTTQPHPYYHSRGKRLFDITLSIVLLIIFCPLLLSIALLVYLTIGTPVIFWQKRTGLNQATFKMVKFRTMRLNAELDRTQYEHLNQDPYPMFKIFNDPRFVGIGRWLSQVGFDELPQLFNILRGEMSFVGPRPLPTNEAKLLDHSWDFRYTVKPGIFSFWTLSKDRHKSLAIWKKLDQMTLKKGGFWFECWLFTQFCLAKLRGKELSF